MVKEIFVQARKTRKSKLFRNILEYFYRATITLIKIFIYRKRERDIRVKY